MWWSLWWIWIIAGLALAIMEVLVPVQIFLGFALGAAGVGAALLLGVPGLAGSIPALCLTFAVLSLAAWLILRPLMGVRKGQVKHFEHDINED